MAGTAASCRCAEGAVRLRIDRFALTSNNITYGAFGEAMSYWSFFPTGDAATGCIPVWGFADRDRVAQRRAWPSGERFYGYYPIADEVVLHPVAVDAQRFIDGAPHRRELHAGLQPVPALQQRPALSARATRTCSRCTGRCSPPRS